MTFFKVVADGQAVDAGRVFLRWYPRHKCLLVCDPSEAHYGQSYDGQRVYRIEWLNPPPEGAPVYPVADAREIGEAEYNDLIEILPDEPVPEPEPEPEPGPEPEPEPEPTPEPERPMSVQEMRERIEALTALVMNEAAPFTAQATFQTGEIITNGARVYIASQVIVQGETVTPGVNCIETSIADAINALQARDEEE